MSAAIDSITEAKPHLFATGGAYAQAFGLFDASIALGTIFGPVWAGTICHLGNWWIMNLTLALICASGAVPVVSGLLASPLPAYHQGNSSNQYANMTLEIDPLYREARSPGIKSHGITTLTLVKKYGIRLARVPMI